MGEVVGTDLAFREGSIILILQLDVLESSHSSRQGGESGIGGVGNKKVTSKRDC
jgi:hypothetical protein